MRGDHIQHVLWQIKFGLLPATTAGTNNLSKNNPFAVAEGILQVGYSIKQRLPSSKIILTSLLPRGLKTSKFPNHAISVNNYLGGMLKPGDSLLYLKPSGWTLSKGISNLIFIIKIDFI